jgi:hypothetical protein
LYIGSTSCSKLRSEFPKSIADPEELEDSEELEGLGESPESVEVAVVKIPGTCNASEAEVMLFSVVDPRSSELVVKVGCRGDSGAGDITEASVDIEEGKVLSTLCFLRSRPNFRRKVCHIAIFDGHEKHGMVCQDEASMTINRMK